jgi:hypothetical protein
MGQPFGTKGIDNAGPYPIVTQTPCEFIEVEENFSSSAAATADLRQYNEDQSSPVIVPKGLRAVFAKGPYIPTQIVGYLNTIAGSITVRIMERHRK